MSDVARKYAQSQDVPPHELHVVQPLGTTRKITRGGDREVVQHLYRAVALRAVGQWHDGTRWQEVYVVTEMSGEIDSGIDARDRVLRREREYASKRPICSSGGDFYLKGSEWDPRDGPIVARVAPDPQLDVMEAAGLRMGSNGLEVV